MILEGIRSFWRSGILGMNRRNAEYIMRFNSRSFFPLVDDKIQTKHLAQAHQIPTPPLYDVIRCHGDVAGFEDRLGAQREFVVKPSRGAGGSGIILITGRTDKGFLNQSGELISREDLSYHTSGILSGIYSLEGLEDRVLIEGLIRPDPVFGAVAYRGVPDIRIITYRGVPAMGMVRLPTRASDGKANLHRGAIGVGIDMGKGVTLTGVHHGGVVTHHPDTGNPVEGIAVPYWEKMLLIAARCLDMTRLGYLGVDLVIDREQGPVLLEINARPGLQIQIANRAGLRRRLDLIDQMHPSSLDHAEGRAAWSIEHLGHSVS
jgi:alpha-L-glutamate ligase-like protein